MQMLALENKGRNGREMFELIYSEVPEDRDGLLLIRLLLFETQQSGNKSERLTPQMEQELLSIIGEMVKLKKVDSKSIGVVLNYLEQYIVRLQ